MDRRLDKRYPTNLEVTVTDVEAPARVAAGFVVDVSESGICISISSKLAPGSTVKAEVGDFTLFGHVVYCNGKRPFRTGIEVVPVLLGESGLARLLYSVLGESETVRDQAFVGLS